jgi:hypothetical protein
VTRIRLGFLLGTSLAAGLVACQAGGNARAVPAEAAVSVSVTPGKPGAPTETVEAAKRGPACTLRVRRVADDGRPLAQASVELSLESFASVWKVVARSDLESFVPEEEEGRVFDFGERRLRIESKGSDEADRRVHEVAWIRPIANAARVEPLRNALARLARERAPEVPLHYLAPR